MANRAIQGGNDSNADSQRNGLNEIGRSDVQAMRQLHDVETGETQEALCRS